MNKRQAKIQALEHVAFVTDNLEYLALDDDMPMADKDKVMRAFKQIVRELTRRADKMKARQEEAS